MAWIEREQASGSGRIDEEGGGEGRDIHHLRREGKEGKKGGMLRANE